MFVIHDTSPVANYVWLGKNGWKVTLDAVEPFESVHDFVAWLALPRSEGHAGVTNAGYVLAYCGQFEFVQVEQGGLRATESVVA